MQSLKRPLYLLAGYIALAVGAIGVVLPLLPTTPFIILAAFFFSKGSERMHQWLLNRKSFGPMIRGWEKYKVIPLKAKVFSTVMMVTMVSYPLLFRPFALWLKVVVVFVVFYGMWFVWRHRSEPLEFAIRKFQQNAPASTSPASASSKSTASVALARSDSFLPESDTQDISDTDAAVIEPGSVKTRQSVPDTDLQRSPRVYPNSTYPNPTHQKPHQKGDSAQALPILDLSDNDNKAAKDKHRLQSDTPAADRNFARYQGIQSVVIQPAG